MFFYSVLYAFVLSKFVSFYFKSLNDRCNFKKEKVAAKISKYVKSPAYGNLKGNEKWLDSIVANKGPVAVAVYASPNFQNYKSYTTNSSINIIKLKV